MTPLATPGKEAVVRYHWSWRESGPGKVLDAPAGAYSVSRQLRSQEASGV